MRPLLRLAALCGALMLSTGSLLVATTHRDSALHYQFEVPWDWERIPDEITREALRSVAQTAGRGAPGDFTAAYQAVSNQHFRYPYLTLQHLPVDPATVRMITSQMASASQLNRDELKKLAEIGIESFEIGEPIVDPERRMILIGMESQASGGKTLKGLAATLPGRDGMVQFHFYADDRTYDVHLGSFEAMLDSFRFDVGYEYDWPAAETDGFGWSERANLGLVIGGFVLLWLLLRWDRAKRQS